MVTSSNGNIFRAIVPLWEESTGHRSAPPQTGWGWVGGWGGWVGGWGWGEWVGVGVWVWVGVTIGLWGVDYWGGVTMVTAVTVPELRRYKAMAITFYMLLVFSAYRPHLMALNIVSDHIWLGDYGGAIGIDQQTFIFKISVDEKRCERR